MKLWIFLTLLAHFCFAESSKEVIVPKPKAAKPAIQKAPTTPKLLEKNLPVEEPTALPVAKKQTESQAGGGFSIVQNQSQNYPIQGFSIDGLTDQPVQANATLGARAGYEHFSDGNLNSMDGIYGHALAHFDISSTKELYFDLGYHSLGELGGDFSFYGKTILNEPDDSRIAIDFKRELLQDSFTSYAGQIDNSKRIGRGRLHEFSSKFDWKMGVISIGVHPGLGWIVAENAPSNFRAALGFETSLEMINEPIFEMNIAYKLTSYHYNDDHSGNRFTYSEPFGSGYFSPKLFVEQMPEISARFKNTERDYIGAFIGPAFQWNKEFQKDSTFETGVRSGVQFKQALSRDFILNGTLGFSTVEKVYRRFHSSFALTYLL